MKYQLLLFDADDTLFDFKTSEQQALRQTFETLGLAYEETYHLPLYHDINKPLWQAAEAGTLSLADLNTIRFEQFVAQLDLPIEATVMADAYVHQLAANSILFDDSFEVIEKLSQRYRLAILTNDLTVIQEKRIAQSPLSNFFEAVFISESMGYSKPDARFFEKALNMLKHEDKASVLMVGDSLSSDITGGINFGIDTCWYNPNHLPNKSGLVPTYEIDQLVTLLAL